MFMMMGVPRNDTKRIIGQPDMGNPIGKENVMMAESSSDGDAFHLNGTLCQSLSNTSIDAHFLPSNSVA